MEIALMYYFGITKNLIIPNVTDQSGLVRFESDILVLSKSGYATCVEIKVSKADLKNDLKKTHIKNCNSSVGFKRYFSNLKYFYYAVPKNLESEALNQIPSFAGLFVIDKYKGRSKVKVVRKPEMLFQTKWTDKMTYQLARLGALRILKYKSKLLKL